MTLDETEVGSTVHVEDVGGDRSFRRRLMELGLVPGTRVRLNGVAPLGDPLELVVRGCNLSIRRSEARSVRVSRPDAHHRVALPVAAPTLPAKAGCHGA
jgi:ferrous iron transport protein A